MFKAFEFCIPTKAASVPSGPDWLHEIKYDGYRLRLERDGERVRLITRGGSPSTIRNASLRGYSEPRCQSLATSPAPKAG